jgi:heme-degrading monooxygenase HmoA
MATVWSDDKNEKITQWLKDEPHKNEHGSEPQK